MFTVVCFLHVWQKERVTNVMKQSLLELGMDVLSIESDFDHVLEAVSRCPQQKAES